MNYSPEMIARVTSMGLLSQRWMLWSPWVFTIPLLGYFVYLRKFFPRAA